MSKRKLKILTIAEKVNVINAVERSGKKNYEVANEFGIPSSTLSTIMKNKTKIMADFRVQPGRKKMKPAEYPDLDASLFEWFVQCRDGNVPVGGPALKRKADVFAKSLGHSKFKNSTGWLDKWKKRNNVVLRKPSRVGVAIANPSSSTASTAVASTHKDINVWWWNCYSTVLGQYSPDDVFAADQTAVLFKCLPGCLRRDAAAGDPRRTCCGERVTVALCANTSGTEKLRPLIVGRPTGFRGVKSSPVDYESDPGPRMTASLWNKWLRGFDDRIAGENRKVVLFVDQRVAHAVVPAGELRAVNVRGLPADVAFKPLGPGVIRDFKAFYRREVIRKIVSSDVGLGFSIDLPRAARMIDKAWRRVRRETIANCYKTTGFSSPLAVQTCNPPSSELGARDETITPAEWSCVVEQFRLKPEDTFDSYVKIDENLPVCGGNSSAEVMPLSNDTSADNGSDESSNSKKVTICEASKALDVLRDFIESTEGMNKIHFEALATIEDVVDKIKRTEIQQPASVKK